MPKTYFEQYVEYRLLDFKFSTIGQDSKGLSALIDDQVLESPLVRQVCAKLSVELVDQLTQTVNKLDISKRRFIEMALIDAISKVNSIEAQVDVSEFIDNGQMS